MSCLTWLNLRDMTQLIYDMTLWNSYVAWLIYEWHVSCPVQYDSFTWHDSNHIWRDSLKLAHDMTHLCEICVMPCLTRLIHDSFKWYNSNYIWQDSLIPDIWHDSFMSDMCHALSTTTHSRSFTWHNSNVIWYDSLTSDIWHDSFMSDMRHALSSTTHSRDITQIMYDMTLWNSHVIWLIHEWHASCSV